MEWYKDGVNVTEPKDNKMKVEGNKLVIQDPQNEDAGNYTCRTVLSKANGTIVEKNIEVIGKSRISFSLHKLFSLLIVTSMITCLY
jgi:hypothetical protein